MPKVFIYNDRQYVSQTSAGDLATIFENPAIFDGQKPDIKISELDENFDGLKLTDKPTIIIPGGRALYMGITLSSQHKTLKINKLITEQGFDYAGFCAGAYLAATTMDLFRLDYTTDHTGLEYNLPTFAMRESEVSLKLIPDLTTLGPFYPNQSRVRDFKLTPGQKGAYTVSCATDITFTDTRESVPQLYVGGCAFPVADPHKVDTPYEVVATYNSKKPYVFNYKTEETTHSSLAAMLQSKKKTSPATTGKPETTQGNIFLSAVHPESSLGTKSTMLQYFSTKKDDEFTVTLPPDQTSRLISSSEKTHEQIADVLRRALK